MFSLRKRAKLDELNSVNFDLKKIETQNNSLKFQNLPIEIYYSIFDALDIKSLLTLRLVNKFFKNILDNAVYFWSKLSVNIEIGSKFDIHLFDQFVTNKPNLISIR